MEKEVGSPQGALMGNTPKWCSIFIFCMMLLVLSCASTEDVTIPTELSKGAKLETVVQTGHSASITSIAFSLDGRYVLSGSKDHTVKLWDVFLGREIRAFKGHSDVVSAVAFIPKSRLIISGSWDNTLKIWDATTGEEIRTLKGHTDRVTSVSVTRDGRYALSGSGDYSIIMWRIPNGSKHKVLRGHKFVVRSNPNPGLTSTGYEDRDHSALGQFYLYKARLKDPKSAKRYATMGHIDAITSSAIDPSGRYILSSSMDRTLRLWDLNSVDRKTVHSLTNAHILSVSFSPDGKYAICGGNDNLVRLINIQNGKLVRTLQGHRGAVNSVMFSPGGQRVLSASSDGTVKLWDLDAGIAVRTLSGYKDGVNASAFSPDGRYIIAGGENGEMILWETNTGLQVKSLKSSASAVNAMALLPRGKYLLAAYRDRSLKLWNTITGHQEKIYRGHLNSVTAVAIFSKGRTAASGSRDGRIIIWDIYTGDKRFNFKVTEEPIRCISISPDDQRLLVGTEKGALLMIVPSTGQVLWQVKETEAVNSVAFSPDGKFILNTSPAKRFAMRDASSGKIVQMYQGHFFGVQTAVFAYDGRKIISSGGDQTVKEWDAGTGQLLRTNKGHSGNVTTVSVSPDGQLLLSGSTDQKLILWDQKSGRQLMALSGHSDLIKDVCFSPDSQYIYSGSGDATLRKWHIPTASELGRMHGSQDGEWITTTSDGYYTKSLEGNNLVHYVIPGIFETYSYEQFEELFHKPQIVQKRLEGCVNCGKPSPGLSQPPQLDLRQHRSVEKTQAQTYPLTLKAASHNLVKAVRVFVNGKPAIEVPVNAKEMKLTLNIPLISGANRITAIAYDENSFFSSPKYLDVISENLDLAKPNLYIIGMGISDYPKLSRRWQLDFAHTDTISLVETMQKEQGKLYGQIRNSIITNEDATVEKIFDVLEAHSNVSENDVVIIHMAGHGIKDKSGTFYFLTSTVNSIEEPQNGGLSWSRLHTYLSKIKGRVILFLDACHSGSIVTETVVPNDKLAQEFFSGKRGGVMVFSASKGRQYSLESPDIGNGAGVFTYALLQGLGEKSNEVDLNGNGVVEFLELVDYVSNYVDGVTKGQQTPWLSRKELFGDLPVATVQ
jgi:WD40 repeat protein